MAARPVCPKCADLNLTVHVESASALENAIKVVRDNLEDGTIVEVDHWPKGNVRFAPPPFRTINPGGPWPDVLLYFFSCTDCGTVFQLSVESFHGFGGSWSPLP